MTNDLGILIDVVLESEKGVIEYSFKAQLGAAQDKDVVSYEGRFYLFNPRKHKIGVATFTHTEVWDIHVRLKPS